MIRKKYDIFKVALVYAKAGVDYFNSNSEKFFGLSSRAVYSYAIMSLYGVAIAEEDRVVWEAGETLKNYLKSLKGTPVGIDRLNYSQKVRLVVISISYFELISELVDRE